MEAPVFDGLELCPKVDGAVKSWRLVARCEGVFFGPVKELFLIRRVSGGGGLISPPLPAFLCPDRGAAANVEAQGTQEDDVAHGRHAANAQAGQPHLIFEP